MNNDLKIIHTLPGGMHATETMLKLEVATSKNL